MEAVITIDVLRRAGGNVAVASVEPGSATVAAAWGIKLAADALLTDLADAEFDLISLPGGMPGSSTFRDCKVLEDMVKKHVEKGKLYAAICAAPAMALGTWGLLNGLKATCYPSYMDKLPSEVHAVESRVQIDGKCVTSHGPGTAMEYSLVLVEHYMGRKRLMKLLGRWHFTELQGCWAVNVNTTHSLGVLTKHRPGMWTSYSILLTVPFAFRLPHRDDPSPPVLVANPWPKYPRRVSAAAGHPSPSSDHPRTASWRIVLQDAVSLHR